MFEDTGTTGPNKVASVSVDVTSGEFAGYQHSGTLQGGNITISLDNQQPHRGGLPCALGADRRTAWV
ncbi:MAG TPA: hypothetical protein VEX41_02275 [Candidatus Eisenbacteria bacterium]|nr:hypothetical protein [Candidatus Eisenbacteria bacterium]